MKYFFLLCLVGGFCIAQSVGAQDTTYTSMVTLPKLSGGEATAEQYVNILYILSISIAGILAMVKIIFAGVKYMLTDVVVAKGDAKKDILGALLGLVIVLGAVLILNTINPQLSTISFFRDGPSVGVVGSGGANQPPIISRGDTVCVEGTPNCTEENCNGEWGPSEIPGAGNVCSGELITPGDPNHDIPGDVTTVSDNDDIVQRINDFIKDAEANGLELATQPLQTNTQSSGEPRTTILNCKESGGTSYKIFARSNGAGRLICLKEAGTN